MQLSDLMYNLHRLSRRHNHSKEINLKAKLTGPSGKLIFVPPSGDEIDRLRG